METLNKSKRSSSIADSDISDIENEIMQKSGINIAKNNDKTAPDSRQVV